LAIKETKRIKGLSLVISATDDGDAFGLDHGFVSHAVSLQGQGLMSVADVPVSGLDLLDATCSHCLPVLVLCLMLALDLLHHRLHPRGGVLSRDEDAVALNVFHVLIIGDVRGIACPYVTLNQVV